MNGRKLVMSENCIQLVFYFVNRFSLSIGFENLVGPPNSPF